MQKIQLAKKYKLIDELLIVKLYGYKSVDHYYEESSSMHDLKNLNFPSLFFNSKDDILSPIDSIDMTICKI